MSVDTQKKIKDVQAECEMYWLMNRIPHDRAEEMTDELGQHLEEAVQNGKTVEDVVGPDAGTFAESWAEEDRPDWTAKDRVMEYAFTLSFWVAYAAVAFHLLYWTPFLSVHWSTIPMLLFLSWLPTRRSVLAGPLDVRPWWRRWLWPAAAILFMAVAWLAREELRAAYDVLDIAITGGTDGTLFMWPWYGTVVAVAVNLAVGRLRKK